MNWNCFRDNKARRLTRDHCASDPEEKKRIIGKWIDMDKVWYLKSILISIVHNSLCIPESFNTSSLLQNNIC